MLRAPSATRRLPRRTGAGEPEIPVSHDAGGEGERDEAAALLLLRHVVDRERAEQAPQGGLDRADREEELVRDLRIRSGRRVSAILERTAQGDQHAALGVRDMDGDALVV